jgi:hypothetical protein
LNKGLSFAIAALQALIIAATTIGLVIAPLTLVWLIEGDGSVGWLTALQVAIFAFLLATGVPLNFSAGEILGIEFPDFVLSTLPLGLTLLMALMTIRIGHRLSAASSLWPAWVGGALSFGLSGLGTSSLANSKAVMVGEWEPLLIPALFFGGLLFIASTAGPRFELFEGANGPEAPERAWVRAKMLWLYTQLHWSIRTVVSPGARIGLGVVAALLLTSATMLALALGFGWIEVVRLYEALRVSALGGVLLTIGQLAILPNLLIYAMAWISGVGFSIGTGSLVSPLVSQLGPLPAFPIFAALPTAGFERGILFILIPVLAAFIGTLLVRARVDQIRWEYATRLSGALALSVTAALTAAATSFLLALLASSSFGPGRFAEVGVSAPMFAVVIFFQVLIPSFLAALIIIKPFDEPGGRRK